MAGEENENEASGSGCNGCSSESCHSGQPKKGNYICSNNYTQNEINYFVVTLVLFHAFYISVLNLRLSLSK